LGRTGGGSGRRRNEEVGLVVMLEIVAALLFIREQMAEECITV
jgi:hypothetical protein